MAYEDTLTDLFCVEDGFYSGGEIFHRSVFCRRGRPAAAGQVGDDQPVVFCQGGDLPVPDEVVFGETMEEDEGGGGAAGLGCGRRCGAFYAVEKGRSLIGDRLIHGGSWF